MTLRPRQSKSVLAIKLGLPMLLASTFLLATPALSQTATAGSEPADKATDNGEIVVTARRRSESIQRVPASITAFGEEEIKTANITRPSDFIALTPGVSQVQTVEVGDFQINIRGINSGRDTESSVALVVDGVLVTNPNALNQELDNITQIEVLKGPQGALYGRNALAGAIIMTTRAPQDHFEGRISASAGKFGLWSLSGGVSGPLASGVKGSINAFHRQDNGSFTNTFTGCTRCENQSDETGVSGRVMINLGSSTVVDLKARYSKVKAGGVTFNASLAFPGAVGFSPLFFEDPNDHKFVYINGTPTDNRQETINFSAKVESDLGAAKLTLIGTYNDARNRFISPGVSNAFGIYNANSACQAQYAVASASAAGDPNSPYTLPAPFYYGSSLGTSFMPPYPPISSCAGNQYQQRDQIDGSIEARLTSNSDGPLQWMVGGYFARIKRHLVVAYSGDQGSSFGPLIDGFATSAQRNPTDLLYDDNLYSSVYAGFANATYDILPTLELAAALRYDVEVRSVSNNVPKISPQTPGFGAFGGSVCPSGPSGCSYYINPYYNANPTASSIPGRSATFSQPQPKVTLTWKPSSKFTAYASYGYGFRSGGFNSSGTTATLFAAFGTLMQAPGVPNLNFNALSDQFKKEVSRAAEIGFKAKLFDNKLTLNAAVFHTIDINGQDFSFFAGPFGSLRVVTNIDKARLQGVEADFRWKPTPALTIYGGIGFTDSKIIAYSVRPYTAGNKVPYIPEYNANLGAEVRLPFNNNLDFVARVDTSFVGKTWFSPVQSTVLPNFFTAFGYGPGDFSQQYRDPYTTTNLSVGLQSGSWDVSFWATNLFDTKYLAEVIPAPEFGGSFIHDSYGRTFGVKASLRFGGN